MTDHLITMVMEMDHLITIVMIDGLITMVMM